MESVFILLYEKNSYFMSVFKEQLTYKVGNYLYIQSKRKYVNSNNLACNSPRSKY